MKNPLYFLFGVSLAALVCMAPGSCATGPTPAPGQSVCEQACANLATLGCAEGKEPTCAATCQKTQDAGLTNLHPDKLAAAKSVADVLAVGTVECTADDSAKAPATCATACANVQRWCPTEGPGCLVTCQKAVAGKVTDLKLQCLSAAKSKTQLQGCKSVACP